MNILHVTNEFSKKNYSIASLIIHLFKFYDSSEDVNVKIVTAKIEDELFSHDNISLIRKSSWINIFLNLRKILNSYKNEDVVHVHGIWAPIQLITIIYGCLNRNNLVIHPHGMLLPEALKSAGKIKYLFKVLTLNILKLILNKDINFVSITDQEKKAINKFFKTNNVTQIPNPLPFKLTEQNLDKKKNKRFVYFGRIHPHKNIELLINAFLQANLDTSWSLVIYGIKDDEKYFYKILDLIRDKKNIQISEPVFDEQRQKIMAESWSNILVSKSEVLSLSILESCNFGLPTLTNKNVEFKQLDSEMFVADNQRDISKKIEQISLIKDDERIQKGLRLNNIFKSTYLNQNTKSIYENLYELISIKRKQFIENLFSLRGIFETKNINFLAISGGYAFNLMFSSFLIISLVLFQNYSVAAELGLTSSFWLSLTQIFSSNMRSIITSENSTKTATDTLLYRILFSLISILLFYFLLVKNLQITNLYLILSISILILSQWVFEMTLLKYEITNKLRIFYLFSILNFSLIIIVIILLSNLNYSILSNIFVIYSIILLVISLFNINLKNLFQVNILKIIKLNLTTIAFASSFSIISSSFIWRLLIFSFLEKSVAGILYACFSLGSFPGTFFNSVIGPTFIKKKIIFSNSLKIFGSFVFIFLVILFIYTTLNIYSLYQQDSFSFLSNQFIIFVATISLIGSFFMSSAMHSRHSQIQDNLTQREILFKKDVFYGLSITLFVPILYLSGGIFATSFAFFIASIFAYFNYVKIKNINVPFIKR